MSTQKLVHTCSQQHYSQQPQAGNNSNARQQMYDGTKYKTEYHSTIKMNGELTSWVGQWL